MNQPESIKEHLRKIKALADRGVGGERDAAIRKLDALLKKHKLRIEDIGSSNEIELVFTPRTKWESELLVQVICMVKRTSTAHFKRSPKTRAVWVKGTKIEMEDIRCAYEHYRALFKSELDLAMEALQQAFFVKYKLFNPDRHPAHQHDDEEETAIDPALLERIRSTLSSLRGEAWAKPRAQLESTL